MSNKGQRLKPRPSKPKFCQEAVNRGLNPPFNRMQLSGRFGFDHASVPPEESGEGNKDVEEDGGSAARMKINDSLG